MTSPCRSFWAQERRPLALPLGLLAVVVACVPAGNAQPYASALLAPEEAADADVLNGIAALDGSDHFLVTGKLWPKMFTVRFVPTD